MNLAYMMAFGRGDTDHLLYRLSEELTKKSVRCCGTVQINTANAVGSCDMDVKVLPLGPTLRISQSLGKLSKGCRLDPSALEDEVEQVNMQLRNGADILIVNKFGKHEAEGRGFRTAIAEAITQDIPVLIGVNALNLKSFEDFVGTRPVQIEANMTQLLAWCQNAIGSKKRAA